MDDLTTTVAMTMAEAEHRVRDALSEQGFGVLTEIDIAATLKSKLGVDRPGLIILGACNPEFAHRALEHDPSVALMLPCNVVLEELAEGTRVTIADPRAMITGSAMEELANTAAVRLGTALEALGEAGD